MKLSISEWNSVVSALALAVQHERVQQEQAQGKDPREQKRAYTAVQRYVDLSAKIERESLG